MSQDAHAQRKEAIEYAMAQRREDPQAYIDALEAKVKQLEDGAYEFGKALAWIDETRPRVWNYRGEWRLEKGDVWGAGQYFIDAVKTAMQREKEGKT